MSKLHWKVISKDSNNVYDVKFYPTSKIFGCDCSDYIYRRGICKHIVAVLQQKATNIEIMSKESEK